jgi:hypothetical protein
MNVPDLGDLMGNKKNIRIFLKEFPLDACVGRFDSFFNLVQFLRIMLEQGEEIDGILIFETIQSRLPDKFPTVELSPAEKKAIDGECKRIACAFGLAVDDVKISVCLNLLADSVLDLLNDRCASEGKRCSSCFIRSACYQHLGLS